MIRIRDKDGKTVELPDSATFVEICDTDGNIGFVFFKGGNNQINVFNHKSKEAKAYQNRFNVSFINKVVDLTPRHKKLSSK